jgi:transposase-like protein
MSSNGKRNRQGLSKAYKTQAIGRRHAAGETFEALAAEYEISLSTVRSYFNQYHRDKVRETVHDSL